MGLVRDQNSGQICPMDLQATVIIPTFEDWDRLNICLDCLVEQSADPALFEVIVANNNATPQVPAYVRLPSNTRVIHVPKPGSFAARNAAIHEARGDVLFFTDSDCQPDRRWIEAGLAAISHLGPHGRIAGMVEIFSKGEHWTGPELYDRITYLLQEEYSGEGWCATANLIVRRAAFDLVGPFNDDLSGTGDREWNERASAQGCEIEFSPIALIRHPARASFAELAKKYRRMSGGHHQEELRGRYRKIGLLGHLSILTPDQVHRTMAYPGLSDRQRLQIMWISFRLNLVWFAEIFRLRHLSGKPNRS
jgi:glycosyltransferase involved in cell wall biosynthesis